MGREAGGKGLVGLKLIDAVGSCFIILMSLSTGSHNAS